MKSYLVVFFVLLSFGLFGQTGAIQLYLKMPSPNKNFFQELHYNHFQELFPCDLLKKKNIKTVYITKRDTDSLPTISVKKKHRSSKYIINNNGFVIYYNQPSEVDSMLNASYYQRNANNQIIYTKDSINYKVIIGNKREFAIHKYNYQYREDSIVVIENSNFSDRERDRQRLTYNWIRLFTYDKKKRLTTYSYYGNQYFPHAKNDFLYDENIFIRTSLSGTDTTFFDNQWRPICKKLYNDFQQLKEEKFITYDENNKIKSVKLKSKKINWQDRHKDKPYNFLEYSYKEFKLYYNDEGLLVSITKIIDEDISEYQVYYYTE